MHPAQKHSTQTSTQARSTLRIAQRYSPVALGATLLLALSACSGGATTAASPSATATPSPSATSAKASASPTRTVTVTESTPTAGTVHTSTAVATVSPGTITTASPTAIAASSPSASAKANTSASAVAKASSTANLSSSDVQSAGGSCGSMDATGYLKHNATVQVTSGAVDCLFARELIRQFVVQNPAEVTDKANGERTVMSARCYWKPGDGANRAVPECVSLDGGSSVITLKLIN